MPKVKANNITMNYEQQGAGDPLILIPFLTADNACYAFQVTEYSKLFTCISLDLRGTGESDKPGGDYSTEVLDDDVAAFMRALGIPKAHISGLSLGAAKGMWLAAKHPDMVASLSLSPECAPGEVLHAAATPRRGDPVARLAWTRRLRDSQGSARFVDTGCQVLRNLWAELSSQGAIQRPVLR